jgi:DNA modification methylase
MINLFNQDSLVGMKQLNDNSIDAIITDPPYGIT